MTRTAWTPLSLITCGLLLPLGCESTTDVGTECRHDVCPQANTVTSRACLMTSTGSEIAVLAAEGLPPFREICLPNRGLDPDATGRVACEVKWRLGETENPGEQQDAMGNPLVLVSGPESCDERPFLEPADDEEGVVCTMRQLSMAEVQAGELDGWYYTEDGSDACPEGKPAVRFTDGVSPSEVVIEVLCNRVQLENADGTLTDSTADSCVPLPEVGSADLGEPCVPATVPEEGFDDREALVEVGSQACETGLCMVYRFRGDPNRLTSEQCGMQQDAGAVACGLQEEVEDRLYCTCRCRAGEDAGENVPLCECGEGFTCIDVLQGAAQYAGGYCVRDGTFTVDGR